MHALAVRSLVYLIVTVVALASHTSLAIGRPSPKEGIAPFWIVGYLRPDTTDSNRAVLAIDARGWYGVAPTVSIQIGSNDGDVIEVAPASWTGPQRPEFDYLLANVAMRGRGEHRLNVVAEFRLADHTDIGAVEFRLLNDGRRVSLVSQRTTRMERIDRRGRMRYAGRDLVPISRPDRDIETLSPKEHGWTRVIRSGRMECPELGAAGDSARAVVRLIIDEQGQFSELRLIQVNGKDVPQALTECVTRELRKWKFVPGSDGDSRTADWIQLELGVGQMGGPPVGGNK